MTWINATRKNWFVDHAWQYGGRWVEPQDYPADLTAEKDEIGAIIKPDGTVKHRIRQICKTTKLC